MLRRSMRRNRPCAEEIQGDVSNDLKVCTKKRRLDGENIVQMPQELQDINMLHQQIRSVRFSIDSERPAHQVNPPTSRGEGEAPASGPPPKKATILEERRMRRIMRNRKSAAKARARERQTLSTLSKTFETLATERRELDKANAKLRAEVQDSMRLLALAIVAARQQQLHPDKLAEYPDGDTKVGMPFCSSSEVQLGDSQHDLLPIMEETSLEPLHLEDCSILMENMSDDWWEHPPSMVHEV